MEGKVDQLHHAKQQKRRSSCNTVCTLRLRQGGNIMRNLSFFSNRRKLPVLVAAALMVVVIAITMERRTYSMTLEENTVIFQRMWDELFNQRNLAVADELFAPDFVNHVRLVQVTETAPPPFPPGPGHMKQLVTTLTTAFPDSHFTVEDVIAAGDKVVGRITWSGTHRGEFLGIPATGKTFKVSHIQIYRFAEGKMVEHWAVRDDLSMLRQLGLVPPLGRTSSSPR
jgi:steroid delta-isomerase-like uncharacterized protein